MSDHTANHLNPYDPNTPVFQPPSDATLPQPPGDATLQPTHSVPPFQAPGSQPHSQPHAFQPPSSQPPSSQPPSNAAKKSGTGVKIGVAALGVFLLAGGGAFAYSSFVKKKSNTPVEAVESFYTAVANGDLVGIAESMEPGERDVILDSVLPMVKELNRLELTDNVDPKKLRGFTGSLTDFSASEKVIRADLAEVTISKGTLKTTFDPKLLPFGKTAKELFGDGLADSAAETSSVSLASDTPFVVHKTGSRWYVSVNYSLAETTRRNAVENGDTFALPAITDGVKAKGAKSPEEATAAMMQAIADVNVKNMLQLMAPDEVPALQNYATRFLTDAQNFADTRSDLFKLTVKPDLASQSIGNNRSLVTVKDLPFNLTAKVGDGGSIKAIYEGRILKASADFGNNDKGQLTIGRKVLDGSFSLADGSKGSVTRNPTSIDAIFSLADGTRGVAKLKNDTMEASLTGDESVAKLSFADECLTIDTGDGPEKTCGLNEILALGGTDTLSVDQLLASDQLKGLGLNRLFPSSVSKAALEPSCVRKRPQAKVGIVTVQRDGLWYVSPSRTIVDAMTAILRTYEPADFKCAKEQFEKSASALTDQIASAGSGFFGDNEDTLSDDTADAFTDPFATDTSPFPTDPFDSLPASEETLPTLTPDEEAELDKILAEIEASTDSAAAFPSDAANDSLVLDSAPPPQGSTP